jgi:CRP-like cAMP-binding protein
MYVEPSNTITHASTSQAKPQVQHCASCILDHSEYFRDLPIAAKQYLQKGVQRKTFARHEMLYYETERNDYLYIMVSGGVKVYKSASDGRQQIHKLVAVPGDLVACEDLFQEAAGSSAAAIEDTVLCGLHRDFLQEASQRYAEISNVLMRVMASKLNAYIRHVANLGSKTALQKVSSYLVFRLNAHSQRKTEPGLLSESLTRVELAEMMGITHRTLIRSLKDLEADRIIKLVKDGYSILDLPGLMHRADGE